MSEQETTRLPQPGEGWRHYKGGLYAIVGVGHDTRDGNALVIYRSADWRGDGLWVRPLGEFLGFTEDHKPRFVFERSEVT